MSPAHFSRQFRAAYGETPYSYLMTRRIERAMALLRAGVERHGCVHGRRLYLARLVQLAVHRDRRRDPERVPGREHRAVKAMPACVAKTQHASGPHRIEQDRRSGAQDRGLEFAVMTIALQYCNITVNDVDESIAFYRDALGLEVRNDVASGEYRWVTLGSDEQPELGIVLSVPHAGRSQADGDALQELLTKGVLPMLVFRSDDVDATFETLRGSGAEVLQEPMDQAWGPRDCAFRDPSGNMVRIAQAPAA